MNTSIRFARRWALLACALTLVACTKPAPKRRSGPTLDIYLSAGDSWWIGTWLPVDSPGSIAASVALWTDLFDIKRIYWRGQQEEMMIDHGIIRKENVRYHQFFNEWERYLMKEEKVNQVLVQEAHRRRVEVYLWAPLFDFGGPADSGGCAEFPYFGQINLTLKNPEWMPVDRYGVRRQNGPIEFAYPEARKALIAIYLEYILRDNLDGIAFFTYSENYGLRFEDEFGYNQPIVDEYRRRYGVDIRTQEFDKHAWRQLRGEYVTQFLRDLKAALRPHGKKVSVRLNPREPNYPDRWNVPLYFLTAGRIYLDWERWVREEIVDELAINGSAPSEVQHRTIENVLDATHNTGVSVSCLTSRPFSERFKPYVDRGMRILLFGTDEASYLQLIYPEQPPEALAGKDVYALMRFLAQVAAGKSQANTEALIACSRHANLLVRRMALKALGASKDEAAVPALEAALDDPERSVRSAAALALGHVHGRETMAKVVATLKRVREFQFFEAAAGALTGMGTACVPEVIRLARDGDMLMRRLAVYVLGRLAQPQAIPTLIQALADPDVDVRFRAAHALQVFKGDPAAVDALQEALRAPEPIVQNRAAVSLAIALVDQSTIQPRLGLESSIRTLNTPTGSLPALVLNQRQQRALDALVDQFRQFGDGSKRPDLDWGFRPVGNAILAFGAEGGKRLQAIIDRKTDRQLAELAWQVLYIRQAADRYCTLPDAEEENADIFRAHPRRDLVKTEPLPPRLRYNPLDK